MLPKGLQLGGHKGGSFAVIGMLLITLLFSLFFVLVSIRGYGPRSTQKSSARDTVSKQAGLSFRNWQADRIQFSAIDLCFEIERSLQALVPYTVTRCMPSQDANGLSFMVSSVKPIFAIHGAKKAWLTGIVSVMGKALNDHQGLVVDHIWVSDGRLLAKQQAFTFRGTVAKELQRKVQSEEISLEALYRAVSGALHPYPLPEKWVTST
jgi:hypothetical protein